MDPLSILGIASNVIQFIDFAGNILSAILKLCRSTEGALSTSLEVEVEAMNLKQTIAQLTQSSLHPRTSQEEVVMVALADSCEELANDVLAKLESLKVRGPYRKW